MAQLSWNEVRDRALRFSKRWSDEGSEAASKQTFWNEFFSVFGRERRTVATFEVAVKNLAGRFDHIDLLWRGVLLVEHKSRGKSLSVAESQAFRYVENLAREGRFDEIPRFIVVSDFEQVALYDLEPEDQQNLPLFVGNPYRLIEFPLSKLHENVRRFAFIKGERAIRLDPEDPANQKAYDLMCGLHDELAAMGFRGTDLERLLVRLLFCLFADDIGIFEPSSFESFIRNETRIDGSDVGARLNELFEILNTPGDQWATSVRETFGGFRYINGDLFKDNLKFPPFTAKSRGVLLAASEFQWAKVSPAVFGSLFQGILDDRIRRQEGAHYTSERDIMKVIRALFLDELRADFKSICADGSTRRKTRLDDFHARLRSLRFLDPACGCGNFLVLAYRELRMLELELLQETHVREARQQFLDVRHAILVDVDQFYGVERSEWPTRIAEVAMWLMDHQMNQHVSEQFGESFERLPLARSPHIVQANALRVDWKSILPPQEGVYVLGNPPFVGKHYQSPQQKEDMKIVFGDNRNIGDIDYVVAWFKRAAEYIAGTRVRVAFVATSSVTQGEQVPLVWGILFNEFHVKIHFAYRAFGWTSESRGAAHVDVVIIGFASYDIASKQLVEYDNDRAQATSVQVSNISPYLTAGSDLFVVKRSSPLIDVPRMGCGSKPTDGGHLLFTNAQKEKFLTEEPGATKFFRPFVGSDELINGNPRWCLWLVDARPDELRSLPAVMERADRVREFRERSSALPTRNAAAKPTRFFHLNQPPSEYIAVPEVSSERRIYIPIGFLGPDVIASNKLYVIPEPSLFVFGILASSCHMAWVRIVSGRLESRFQYSASMVYNTFPWPVALSTQQTHAVEKAARNVLSERKPFLAPQGSSTLGDLYDPLSMPPGLRNAHSDLDRTVDRLYRKAPFKSERERVDYLFAAYEAAITPLLHRHPKDRARRRRLTAAADPVSSENDVSQDTVSSSDVEKFDGYGEPTVPILPEWFRAAFRPRQSPDDRGQVVENSLDIIYDHLDDMLEEGQYIACNSLLETLASAPNETPLDTLVGILTITRAAAKHLSHRDQFRTAVRRRLSAAGQNADSILKGL